MNNTHQMREDLAFRFFADRWPCVSWKEASRDNLWREPRETARRRVAWMTDGIVRLALAAEEAARNHDWQDDFDHRELDIIAFMAKQYSEIVTDGERAAELLQDFEDGEEFQAASRCY